MKKIAAIILAAGRGTRMKSEIPKVLHRLHSRPILSFILKALDAVKPEKEILVLGYKDKVVRKAFDGLDTVIQKELLGSGDAVKRTRSLLTNFKGDILVLYGDTPFISGETIKKLVKKHKAEKASCTLLTAKTDDPSGYGRILRDDSGNIIKITEEQDVSVYEKILDEINVGCYCFRKVDLFFCLERIKINRKKREYYLTDVIEMLRKGNKRISSVICEDPNAVLGINSKLDLAKADETMREKILESLMLGGVTIVDPGSTFVDMDAEIGKDTVIHPHTVIEGGVKVGKKCEIGPFARLRDGTIIADNVEIGNFTELVRTGVSSGTKIKHMTYLGDTEVGKNVNIGAGTITANYDGKKKNKTVIEDRAFIGVGAILIAPVTIGKGAAVGAGSVVTKKKHVPPGATVVGIPARLLRK